MSASLHDTLRTVLGAAPERDITPGEFIRFGGRNRPLWVRLFTDGRAAVFGDWRDGGSHTWTESGRQMGPAERAAARAWAEQQRQQREREQRDAWAKNAAAVALQWSRARPLVPGDPVTIYLKNRLGVALWPLPAALRYVPALPYFDEAGKEVGRFPAMLAAISSPAGELLALHRSYLTRDGRKADVPGPVKKLSRTCGPLAGAGIALWSAPDDRGVIGIAEGIETAMAASYGGRMPVCAAYSAGNLAAWQWPAGARHLVVWSDHDEAGIEAAAKLRSRAQRAGLTVKTMTPAQAGTDWCDVVHHRNTAAKTGPAEHDKEGAR